MLIVESNRSNSFNVYSLIYIYSTGKTLLIIKSLDYIA